MYILPILQDTSYAKMLERSLLLTLLRNPYPWMHFLSPCLLEYLDQTVPPQYGGKKPHQILTSALSHFLVHTFQHSVLFLSSLFTIQLLVVPEI